MADMQSNKQASPRLVSAKGLAKQSGWPISRVLKLKEQRAIPYVVIGKSAYFPEDAIRDFLQANMVEAKGASS
ncbi:DNA-binding protein [Ahrensia kielensis]|uniref:DNA-binding protein n=1 Tax=Ahrensia kielensis TaxID=76980 RepID=A0ABU9T6U6_9HYPH